MPRVPVRDIELHVEERGGGAPLLLIAGIPAIADDWTGLAEPLAATRRLIAYDNRGSGRSTVTPGPYSTRGSPPTRPGSSMCSGSSAPTSSACRWAG